MNFCHLSSNKIIFRREIFSGMLEKFTMNSQYCSLLDLYWKYLQRNPNNPEILDLFIDFTLVKYLFPALVQYQNIKETPMLGQY